MTRALSALSALSTLHREDSMNANDKPTLDDLLDFLERLERHCVVKSGSHGDAHAAEGLALRAEQQDLLRRAGR